MTVVNDEVSPELLARYVVNATGTISDITKNQAVHISKLRNDVGDQSRVKEQALGELEADLHCLGVLRRKNFVNCLRNFVAVVPREYTASLDEGLAVDLVHIFEPLLKGGV